MEKDPIFSLLGIDPKSAKEQAFTRGLLSTIFNAAALSGPQARPIGNAQALGQIGLGAMEAYDTSMDRTLREMLTRQQIKASQQPKMITVKEGESLVTIDPNTGLPTRQSVPGLGATSPKFDPATSAFIQFKYPGKSYSELTTEQQQNVIEFANAPDATKQAELDRESKKAKFETGVDVPVPRGRGSFLQPPAPPVAPAPSVAPTSAVTPTVSPVVSPIAQIQPMSSVVSREAPTRVSEAAAIKIPVEIARKPLGENEKPLIDSSAITPKAKQELLLVQPKQIQAVEYVLETNAQMQSVINEILANPGFNDAFGFGGSLISQIPGTDAARVRALLDRLGGNLFIEAITAMRAASATGAAVGNATEKEGDKLQSSRAALLQAQKAEDVRKELENLRDTLNFQGNLVTNSYERTYGRGSFTQRTPQKAPEQRKSLQDIFKGR
jgi:hypothetical protein